MSKAEINGSATRIKLKSYNELLGLAEEEASVQIVMIPLIELHEFQNHPFRVTDDKKMEDMVESIKQHGVLIPGLARKRKDGEYELIAGHRRKRASELAGKTEMPIIVREYSDDEATIIMVDSNIQREDVLPSEKAFAYKMKYEAMRHQGVAGEKSSLEEVGEGAGDNAKMVQRYIRLAELIPQLLAMVDNKQLGFIAGVNLSYLIPAHQEWVWSIMQRGRSSISGPQSQKIKEYEKAGELSMPLLESILSGKKRSERKVVINSERIQQYFQEDDTVEDIECIIYQLLDAWKKKCSEEKIYGR